LLSRSRTPKDARKGLNSLVILVAWSIWKLRNRCVFDSCHPDTHLVLQEINEQATLWKMAGAKALRELLALRCMSCISDLKIWITIEADRSIPDKWKCIASVSYPSQDLFH